MFVVVVVLLTLTAMGIYSEERCGCMCECGGLASPVPRNYTECRSQCIEVGND